MAIISKESIHNRILADVYAYWKQVRGRRKYAEWRAIDPIDIPRKTLPHLIVLEYLPDGDFRYRLTGTQVDRLVGVVPQGKRLSDLPIDQRDALRVNFQSVIQQPEPQLFSLPITTPKLVYGDTTRVALPIVSASGRVDMILGAVIYRDRKKNGAHETVY